MPPFEGVFIVIAQELAVHFWWDDCGGTARIEFCEKPIGVERLVGQQSIECNAIDERLDALHIVSLTWQENEVGQVSERVNQSNDFGGQSAARASNGLILSPLPCAARLLVSLNNRAVDHCIFEIRSTLISFNILSNTPASAHLQNLRNTLFQLTKSAGRSPHGNPVRTRHRTASRNRRLFLSVAPASPYPVRIFL